MNGKTIGFVAPYRLDDVLSSREFEPPDAFPGPSPLSLLACILFKAKHCGSTVTIDPECFRTFHGSL